MGILSKMSNEISIIPGAQFNASSDVKYSKPKTNTSGGKSVGILNSSTNTATYLSTPLMLTWGINEYIDEKSGKVSYDLALQFPGSEYATDATTNFLENMTAFEDKIKADALKNSKEWFGKAKMSADVIDALWTPMLKYPKDKNTGEPDTSRSPTLKVKIPYWEGAWKVELYDLEASPIFPDPSNDTVTPKDLITKGSHLYLMIVCGGIWFANGKFGVTWKLIHGRVNPKTTVRGKCFLEISAEEKALAEKLSQRADVEEEGLVSDDEEDIEEDEEEAAPVFEAPKKKVVKKVVKKKTAEA